MNLKVKNALTSVSNKDNLILLLKTLKKFKVNIISSGVLILQLKSWDISVLNYQNLLALKRC